MEIKVKRFQKKYLKIGNGKENSCKWCSIKQTISVTTENTKKKSKLKNEVGNRILKKIDLTAKSLEGQI